MQYEVTRRVLLGGQEYRPGQGDDSVIDVQDGDYSPRLLRQLQEQRYLRPVELAPTIVVVDSPEAAAAAVAASDHRRVVAQRVVKGS